MGGAPRTHSFSSQGDQRDEEEETQMKKSESEVEVRPRVEQGQCPLLEESAGVQPSLDPGLTPPGGSGHHCPEARQPPGVLQAAGASGLSLGGQLRRALTLQPPTR